MSAVILSLRKTEMNAEYKRHEMREKHSFTQIKQLIIHITHIYFKLNTQQTESFIYSKSYLRTQLGPRSNVKVGSLKLFNT